MMWLEMSRDPVHGGPGWSFGECLWSPTTRRGGGKWGYWEIMRKVKTGDTVVHLRGQPPNAAFVGYSTVDTDCYTTTERPPEPGEWDHAETFYRVPLRSLAAFPTPIPLESVFSQRRDELLQYHQSHSPVRSPDGRYLFFVKQSDRLQCQNGAYLSEFDDELADIVLGSVDFGTSLTPDEEVTTRSQIREMRTRIGQQRFSNAVRENYGDRCCFSSCSVNDRAFLVGSHIARWADIPELRGTIANGLCLCLMHDRAFEVGLFTLTDDFRIAVHVSNPAHGAWSIEQLMDHDGDPIRLGRVAPSLDALKSHWNRIGFEPSAQQ